MVTTEALGRATIAQLQDLVEGLSGSEREVFSGIIKVTSGVGRLRSDTMSLGSLGSQRVVRVYNRPEHRMTKFNEARALRPQDPVDPSKIQSEIEAKRNNDAFCAEKVDAETPLNDFGRVKGESCMTAGNLFLGSMFHAVEIFGEHNPLILPTKRQFSDRLAVADEWYERANRAEPEAIYSSYMWNNLDRAGASMWFHGHAQLQQELGYHEGEMESLLDASQFYRHTTGRDYFNDLFRVHQMVGLGVERAGVMVIPSLTPVKERHIRMISDCFDDPQRDVIFRIVRYFMSDEGFGVKSFNFSIGYRPIAYDGRDWGGFPAVVIDIVDRGDINKRNSDIGASELLLNSAIVATDPYRVNDGIKEALAA